MRTSETQVAGNNRADLDEPEHRAAVLEAKRLLYKRLKVRMSSWPDDPWPIVTLQFCLIGRGERRSRTRWRVAVSRQTGQSHFREHI